MNETAASPAARAAAHGPVCAAIGDGVDQYFGCIIVNNEGNDGFPACRDGTQTKGDFIADAERGRPLLPLAAG